MRRYHNSTFTIRPDAKRLRAKKQIKRGGKLKQRTPLKKKREPPALTRAKRIAKERDGYTCQFPGCGASYKSIDAHHKAKISQRPDLKFDPNNLITLCRTHHNWTDHNHDEAVRMGLLNLQTYEIAKKREAA